MNRIPLPTDPTPRLRHLLAGVILASGLLGALPLLTLRGGWEITKNFGVNVALENLTNRQYRYPGSGSNEPGFNAILGATVKW
jgi:hypothetical protein